MHFIDRLEALIKLRHQQSFLKKHQCSSYKEYQRKYDSDIDPYSGTIQGYYIGYQYLHRFDQNDQLFLEKIIDWCDKNSREKWRYDQHSCIVQSNWSISYSTIFAFQNKRDYIDFVLKWG